MRRVKDYVYVASQKASNCQPVDPVVVPVVRHVAGRVAGAAPAAKRPRAGAGGTREAADGTAAGPAPPSTRGADTRTWAERQQRTEAAWAQQLPAMRQELLKLAKQHDNLQGQRAGDLLAQVQSRLVAAATGWSESHECGPAELSTTTAPMRYVQLLCSGQLSVPTVTCSQPGCHGAFTPSAISVGCFPASPVNPETWFDLEVHRSYSHLLQAGLSAANYVEFLGKLSGTKLDDRQFVGSFFGYLRASHGLTCLSNLLEAVDFTDPFVHCPICAKTAATPHPYRVSMAADANTKVNHFSSCGAAAAGIPPQLHGYFGAVDAEVQARHTSGALNLSSVVQDAGPADLCACASSLHCSRPDGAASRGVCDIHGICGAVCAHGFPILGSFSDMRTPEQFAYYLLMLQELIQLRPDLSDVYIDFGCRLMSTWERFVNNHPDLPPEAKQLRIMVNWMHASGHDSACQLQNSGRYKLGAGARVGEQTEQLWSQAAKPIGGLVRYMTHHHRRDVLEAQLDAVSEDKLDGIVSRLSSRFKDTTRQLRELRAAEEAAIAAAREAAVDDVDVAGAEYIMSVVAPTSSVEAAQDWEAEYVQLLLRKSWLGQLQSGAASLAVVSSSAAMDLAAASTAERLEKLEKAVRALEAKHGVQASVWSRGHPPYDTAICRLRDREVQRCRDRVEALVLEVQQLTTEREEAGCMDKEAKRIAARARRKRKVVRRLLEEMYVWQGVDGGVVERLTEEQVKGLYREGAEQPWGAGPSGGGALRLHHGRRYVETASTRARYEEEEEILCVEKQRLAAWLGDIEPRIQLALAGPAAQCEGTSFILGKRLQQVQRLRAELACSGIPDLSAHGEDAGPGTDSTA